MQNLNIFLKCRKENRQRCGRLSAFHRVHWSRDRQAFDASGPAGPVIGRLWSSCGALPAFCPLYCFACGALHLNMALFRVLRGFLARFGAFVGVCVAWVLCVACVAFVRVYS